MSPNLQRYLPNCIELLVTNIYFSQCLGVAVLSWLPVSQLTQRAAKWHNELHYLCDTLCECPQQERNCNNSWRLRRGCCNSCFLGFAFSVLEETSYACVPLIIKVLTFCLMMSRQPQQQTVATCNIAPRQCPARHFAAAFCQRHCGQSAERTDAVRIIAKSSRRTMKNE